MAIDKIRHWVNRINGPYLNNYGREFINLIGEKRRQTISYPRWLLEQHLERELTDAETVDHIDRNCLNHDVNNLRIVDRITNSSDDAKRVHDIEIECVWCGTKATKKARNLHRNAKQGRVGPFCTKSCAGKYGAELQNGRSPQLKIQKKYPVNKRNYYFKDKKL